MLAQPIEVGVESSDQAREAGAEARARHLGLLIEKDVVEVPQARWRARALQRSADNGKDALVESCRLLHLPGADFGARRARREHENHRVGLADQVAEASFPVLATGDAVTVDDTLKAASIERRIELVGEVQVVATVGDKDAKLSFVGRGGPARLLLGDTSGFRRSWTGCVMRKVCHSTAPIHANYRQRAIAANWVIE